MKIKLIAVISHDGKDCKAGDVLDIADAAAKRLVTLGVAEVVEAGATQSVNKTPGNEALPETSEPPADGNVSASVEAAPEDASVPALELPKIDVDKMSRDELAQELSVWGVGFKANETREQLMAKYKVELAKRNG